MTCVGGVDERGGPSSRVPPDSLYVCPRRYLSLPRILSYIRGAQYEANVTCEEAGCVGEASVALRIERHDVPW